MVLDKNQLRGLVRGARFSRQEERALLDLIDNAAAGGTPSAAPAAAAGTDATIIDAITAALVDYGIFT